MRAIEHSGKGQSALEFLSTYAFVFLIISIVLLLLIILSGIPKSSLPEQCSFYSGFQCLDSALVVNASGAPELLVIASDSEPGVVNISSFSAFLNFHSSKSGYCVPSVATAGEKVYCIANFTGSGVTLGSVYTGTFKVSANYCANSPTNISAYCPSGSQYTYGGSIRVQATKAVLSSSYYLPITITNQQSSAVPSHFQQMIQFAPSTYALEEAPDLGNIRFYYGSKELYSWCETNCQSSDSANAIFWVKLPQAIPPGQSITIDMYFLPESVGYSGVHAGEAPQLSPIYAEYDNGASVFNNYWNFAGTSLPSGWDTITSGATISVNNGIIFDITSSGGGGDAYYSSTITTPSVIDVYVDSSAGTDTGVFFSKTDITSMTWSSVNVDNGYVAGFGGSLVQYIWKDVSNTFSGLVTGSAPFSFPAIITFAWGGTGNLVTYYNYGYALSSTDGTFSVGPYLIGITAGHHISSGDVIYYWFRTRAYPPNGVMPSVTLGTVSSI